MDGRSIWQWVRVSVLYHVREGLCSTSTHSQSAGETCQGTHTQQRVGYYNMLKTYVAGVLDGDGVDNLITHLGDGRINRLGDVNFRLGVIVAEVVIGIQLPVTKNHLVRANRRSSGRV